jgi:4-hydroxy-3-methylbut-2-enyl diphosphate reductase
VSHAGNRTRCCWPNRAASVPALTVPSRSSSAHWSSSARPIYVRHEIVHNTYVVNDLKAKGAIFIEDLAEVPAGATLVFSAHGVSQAVRQEAARRGLPRLRRHLSAGDQGARRGGQAGQGRLRVPDDRPQGPPGGRRHDGPALATASTSSRTRQTCKRAPVKNPDRLAVVTQTTLSVDDAAQVLAEVKQRFPECARTQEAGHLLRHPEPAGRREGAGPAGGRRHRRRQPHQQQQQPPARAGERLGTPAYMIDDASGLHPAWFEGAPRVGLTAGASAPDVLVQQVISRLRELGAVSVRKMDGVQEDRALPAAQGPGRQVDGRGGRVPILKPPRQALRRRPVRRRFLNRPTFRSGPPCSTSTCCAATSPGVIGAWKRRKTPAALPGRARFSALEAERKQNPDRTEELQARRNSAEQADRPAQGQGRRHRCRADGRSAAGIADELAGADRWSSSRPSCRAC